MTTHRMRTFLFFACLLLALLAEANAERYSTEDESRFRSQPYDKAEPGMMAPAVYITTAKVALHKRFAQFDSSTYEEPFVTHRFYRDAPAADRDIICVTFLYKGFTRTPVSG